MDIATARLHTYDWYQSEKEFVMTSYYIACGVVVLVAIAAGYWNVKYGPVNSPKDKTLL